MHLLPITLLLLIPSTLAAVSTVTVTSAAPVSTSSSYTNDADFQSQILAATNFYRMEQNVAAVTWNASIATYAQKWSDACVFKHSGGPTGENLAAGYANASASVDAWGLEREQYNWNKPGFSEATGHFTQLVWSNTTSVGCGRTSCQGENQTPGWYVVCEYFPAGNIVGDNNQYFIDNVKKQVKGKASDTLESGVTSGGPSHGDGMWCVGILFFAALTSIGIVF